MVLYTLIQIAAVNKGIIRHNGTDLKIMVAFVHLLIVVACIIVSLFVWPGWWRLALHSY